MISATLPKRKERRSKSSTSSTETESASPIPKRQKEQEPLLNEHEDAITEDGFDKKENEPDEVLSALGLAQQFDEIISRLGKLDVITNQMQSLHDAVGELENSVSFLGDSLDEEKKKLKETDEENKSEISKLKWQLLKYETYDRRENLRLYGIPENQQENTRETLNAFMEGKLDMEDPSSIEFQRVHRVGRKYPHKPRPILARFLRYPDREYVFSRRSSLEKDEGFGIGIDLPKSVVEMRKKMIPKMVEARKKGQRAAFSLTEPYNLYIDGQLVEYTDK
ncbi:hypothetical protein QZH41_008189 [Actinostola sp. cb2023]|nr:hypothetical protein QZH41_008189 [Actinostola sp. cb2023]